MQLNNMARDKAEKRLKTDPINRRILDLEFEYKIAQTEEPSLLGDIGELVTYR
jgi:hypothetical protein